MREFLKGLELEKEVIDSIMAEYGKIITEEKEKVQEYKDKVSTYEAKIEELNSKVSNTEEIQKELEELRTRKNEEELDKKIRQSFGDKKFINKYTENAFVEKLKNGLKENPEAKVEELFEQYSKEDDKIFESVPQATGIQIKTNPVDEDDGVTAILKAKHPELF